LTTSGTLSDSEFKVNRKSDDDLFDPNKHTNPKKYLLEELDQIQGRLKGDNLFYSGEIKAMVQIVESTSGKKPLNEVEKTIYEIYYKRLLEIRFMIKQAKKKKKNN